MALNDASLAVPNNTAIQSKVMQPNGTTADNVTSGWQSYLTAIKTGLYQIQTDLGTVNTNITTAINAEVVNRNAAISTLQALAIPPGVMYIWSAATAPSGWKLCDGSAISRTTFATLFAVIGTTYGAGDGSTTFNIPNLQSNVPIGASGTYALGSTGGEATHVLTTPEMPAHTHSFTSVSFPSGTFFVTGSGTTTVTAPASTTGSTGGGGAHNNLQPYLALNYIIKT